VWSFLMKVVVNAVAVWVASLIVPGVHVGGGDTGRTVVTLLVVGLLFGLVNAIIKPVVKFLSFPFYILTLGLFAFVVNAAMLEIVDWLSGRLRIAFSIDRFFWSAVLAAVVVTVVSLVLHLVLPDGDRDDD
jgi:putative membrane protein